MQVIFSGDSSGQESKTGKCGESAYGSERLGDGFTEELKNPNPVSGADPSIPRGLFHPNSSKVAPSRCAAVSAVLNLG
ncbi:MAG: hypothetical protein DMG78_03465 [Acidobacteria bacterium]|nr:MAG: hypothetical protein DMG78_03465 [Acidobacteriota bacterium]